MQTLYAVFPTLLTLLSKLNLMLNDQLGAAEAADITKTTGIHENPRLQYFGLGGGARLGEKCSQTVWDKILHLSSKF